MASSTQFANNVLTLVPNNNTSSADQLVIGGNTEVQGSILCDTIVETGPFTPLTPETQGGFKSWITSVSEEAKANWWSTSSTLRFNTVTASGTLVTNGYTSSLLIPDGRVIFIPNTASKIGIFNPNTNTYTEGANATGYACGVLIPDGRVVCIPRDAANIGIYNPNSNTMEVVTPGTSLPGGTGSVQYNGGVLLPNGNVAFIPYNANNMGVFNPVTNAFSVLETNVPTTSNKYQGGVLLSDGRVLCVPFYTPTIGIYTPAEDSSGIGTFANTSISARGYNGCVLLSNGSVLFVPYNSASIGVYTPANDGIGEGTFATSSTVITDSSSKYVGGTLLQDGRAIFSNWSGTDMRIYDPFANSTSVTIAAGFAANSYVNGTLIPDGRVIFPHGNIDGKIGIISGLPPISIERCLHPCFNRACANIPLLPGALDSINVYSTAVGAYALKSLFASYTGPQVRVRRSTDDVEADIWFDANGVPFRLESATETILQAQLDLDAWKGSGATLFVRTWYDQSAGGKHLQQADTTLQSTLEPNAALGAYAVHRSSTNVLLAPNLFASTSINSMHMLKRGIALENEEIWFSGPTYANVARTTMFGPFDNQITWETGKSATGTAIRVFIGPASVGTVSEISASRTSNSTGVQLNGESAAISTSGEFPVTTFQLNRGAINQFVLVMSSVLSTVTHDRVMSIMRV